MRQRLQSPAAVGQVHDLSLLGMTGHGPVRLLGFLLSGFIYSISSMPRVIQAIALFVPARYFINISKGVFLKGIGPDILWPDFLLLCGYGTLIFFFTVRKLRQKVA